MASVLSFFHWTTRVKNSNLTVFKMSLYLFLGFFLILQIVESNAQAADIPQAVALYPLNSSYGFSELRDRQLDGTSHGTVFLANGPDGKPNGSYEFGGMGNNASYIKFPHKTLDVKYSMTMLCWVYPLKNGSQPIFGYYNNDLWSLQVGVIFGIEDGKLRATFIGRTSGTIELDTKCESSAARVLSEHWSYVGASYFNITGEANLWVDGEAVKTCNISKNLQLETQFDGYLGYVPNSVESGLNTSLKFEGRIAWMQVYDVALNKSQIEAVRRFPNKSSEMTSFGFTQRLAAFADTLDASNKSSLKELIAKWEDVPVQTTPEQTEQEKIEETFSATLVVERFAIKFASRHLNDTVHELDLNNNKVILKARRVFSRNESDFSFVDETEKENFIKTPTSFLSGNDSLILVVMYKDLHHHLIKKDSGKDSFDKSGPLTP